jgi:excisionase family DNA binding protein
VNLKGRYLLTSEVAELLRCGPDAVLALARSGRLKGSKPGGNQWLFREEAVTRFLKECEAG